MPTLSAVRAWNTTHLEEAAAHWNKCADWWDEGFDSVYRESIHPGGTDWTGEAALAAQQHTVMDMAHESRAAEALRRGARFAAESVDDFESAKQAVLAVVDEANSEDFSVGENWDVTYTGTVTEDQMMQIATRAEDFAEQLRAKVQALDVLDEEVAAQITGIQASGLDFSPERVAGNDPVGEFYGGLSQQVEANMSRYPDYAASLARPGEAYNFEMPCTFGEWTRAQLDFVGTAGGLAVSIAASPTPVGWAGIAFSLLHGPSAVESWARCGIPTAYSTWPK